MKSYVLKQALVFAGLFSCLINVGSAIALKNSSNDSVEQVTSVWQLSDVQLTDWAFQALQSLLAEPYLNAYGISGIALNPNFSLGGWVGYAHQRYIGRGDAEIWNWAVTLAFPNLDKEGNLGGILVGMKPKVTRIDSSLNNGQADSDTSIAFRSFLQISDNIQITPGVIWLTAPNHNNNNDDVVVGVLRTVFRF